MKIKSVAVLGAGAVGSYVIWGLSQKPEVRLGVIAEGERADRLRKNGCAINGRIYHPEVWSPDVGRILRTFKIKKNVEVTDNGKDNF